MASRSLLTPNKISSSSFLLSSTSSNISSNPFASNLTPASPRRILSGYRTFSTAPMRTIIEESSKENAPILKIVNV